MIEAHAERDLASPDLWATSLERSLARRRRPRRTSIELSTLRGPRDLTEERFFDESRDFAVNRRRVADQLITMPEPAARKLSIAAMTASVAGPGALAFAVWHEVTGGGNHAQAAAAASPKKRAKGAAAPAKTGGATTIAGRPSFFASFDPKADAAARPRPPRPQVLMGSVREVQLALGVQADGVLGPKTVQALKAFQSAHGLKADAVVGQATWAALSPRVPKQKTAEELGRSQGQGRDRHRRRLPHGRPARRHPRPAAGARPQRRRRLRPQDRARSQALPAPARAHRGRRGRAGHPPCPRHRHRCDAPPAPSAHRTTTGRPRSAPARPARSAR